VTPTVLYRDEAVLVIDKPAGLPVHRGPRGGASVEDWLDSLRFGKRRLPQPAHRLDADTSGCLVLGRTKPALAALGRAFADGAVEKVYWAIVRGGPSAGEGEIALPLMKRSSRERGWRMVVDPAGQPALTLWRVLGRDWIELRPRTGRTHQLRVHCAASGWPILGDPVYGGAEPGGLALLARSVSIPALGVAAEAPVPPRLRSLGMGGLGGRASGPSPL
jgi:tRNA pseudouridine32 synthase/23S rRNA pseudouridine746 synthase